MTDKPPIHEALAAVMGDVRALGKDKRNPEFGYLFRGIDAVLNAVGPVLRTHGVLVLPQLLEANYRDVRTSKDKPAREVTVRVRYRFVGPAGDHLDAEVPGEAMDFGDKGTAKAMSVAMRIALLQALALPTDEADPDSHSYERAEPVAAPTAAPETAPEQAPMAAATPSLIRGRIAHLAKEQGRDLSWISEDFKQRTNGKDIASGSIVELQAYLAWLEKQPDVWTEPA